MTLKQEVPIPNLTMAICEKSAAAIGQDTLPKVVLHNDHLLSLDYEYDHGTLEYVKHR